MPHFTILTNDDGSVVQILCDGEPHDGGVSFEPPHQIVSTYFKIARTNLDAMRTEKESNRKRPLGLQAFLMSLTGVEAFTNVFSKRSLESEMTLTWRTHRRNKVLC